MDGNTYDVTVEVPDEPNPQGVAPTIAAPVVASSAPPPAMPPVAAAVPSPAPPPAAAAGPVGAGDVPSPLAGRVTAVVVSVGQEVKEGDHLVTLEAMKMNTFVFAPKSGKVAEVKTAIGATVEEGQALVRIA